MKLHLSGHLNWYDGEQRAWLELELDTPLPLAALLAQLGIPSGEVAVALVNGQASGLDQTVSDGDVVELFPPSAGG